MAGYLSGDSNESLFLTTRPVHVSIVGHGISLITKELLGFLMIRPIQ